MSKSKNTQVTKPSLLDMATASVPESAKFDLEKDEVVKQILAIPKVKVLPNSPTVSMLFESATINLIRIKEQSKDRLYPFEPELAQDADVKPFIHSYQIASGRSADGDMFLSYCQNPDTENPNRFHTSGIRAMQMALEEPVARRPYDQKDQSYVVMRFGPESEVPEIKAPDYDLGEMLELAFDGIEVLGPKSAVILGLKALQPVV